MTQTGLLATKRLEGKTAVITIGNNSLDITMEQQLPINGRRHARMNLMQHSNRLLKIHSSRIPMLMKGDVSNLDHR